MANQSWQITSPGTLSLVTNDSPIPAPGPKEVLVRIHAFSLNYRDVLVRDHSADYPLSHKPNLVPGSDGAGIIASVGSDSRWKKGDRVVVHPNTWWKGTDARGFELAETMGGGDVDGTYTRWKIVSDEKVIKAPDNLSFEEASTLFTAGATAFRSLFHGGVKIDPGKNVLTQGTGGVSCYAIMLAAAAGATVVATSSSEDKLETARRLGATHLVNYRKHPEWSKEVLKATDGKGADLVVDVVGAESIEQTIKATAFAGTICIDGMLGKDPSKPVNILLDILYGAKTVRGQLGAGSREIHQQLAAFMQQHDLHPPVAATFDFEEADKALNELSQLRVPGKVVVRC